MLSNDQLVSVILCAVFAFADIFIMGLRLTMRKLQKQSLHSSDYLTMIAVICVLARVGFITVMVLWGNNNNIGPDYHFTDTEVYQREVGSKLTLADRLVYNTYIWIQKLHASSIVTLYNSTGKWYQALVSFVPSFQYYGAVSDSCKNKGSCTNAQIQLLTFVSLNLTTDVMLLVFPMPWIFTLKQCTLKRRLQIIGLFSIGILLIIIAVVRLPVYSHGTSQVRRDIWGSIEQFGAALVANLPTIYGLRQKKLTPSNVTFVANQSLDRSWPRSATHLNPISEISLVNWSHAAEASGHKSCDDDCETASRAVESHYSSRRQSVSAPSCMVASRSYTPSSGTCFPTSAFTLHDWRRPTTCGVNTKNGDRGMELATFCEPFAQLRETKGDLSTSAHELVDRVQLLVHPLNATPLDQSATRLTLRSY
ncbi:hypothetical protein N7478_008818 [Penicillium angulare]|uniref:uncharacterized protein n=1 Tax=Penicillium angulare TaxID=116970 RepID=UPI00254039DB|nr:uncharacterized protein N7478_008818 [Penicillium angulare]KAJ5273693.1 hypothetical protein N7478_008818 [Penicillium angulare]